MKDLTLPTLLPCPFCGAGETQMRENGRVWGGKGYGEPSSVSVVHWCVKVDGQPSRVLERVGRDKHSAIEAWNTRAALSSHHEDGGRAATPGVAAVSEMQLRTKWRREGYLEAMSAGAMADAIKLLRRALGQLDQWQKKYGERDPDWLPPAGDVQLMEDAAEFLNGRAAITARHEKTTPAPVALGGEKGIAEMLKDPAVVHANMLRGTIAKISMLQCAHTHGEAAVAEYQRVTEVGGEKGEASGPEIYIARVAMLREHAKQAKTVTEEDVLDAASMDADELRRRYLVQKDWHRLFAKCLDGLPFAQHGINGGTCPDGCWFPRDIRAIVERLLVDPVGKARMLDHTELMSCAGARTNTYEQEIQRKFCEVNGIEVSP